MFDFVSSFLMTSLKWFKEIVKKDVTKAKDPGITLAKLNIFSKYIEIIGSILSRCTRNRSKSNIH